MPNLNIRLISLSLLISSAFYWNGIYYKYLMEEWARSTSAPIERRTYDGSSDADVQAEPDDNATPGTLMRSDSPSTAANDIFKIPG